MGTEKTIFKEKEANMIDNIGTLEKKNQLYEDRVLNLKNNLIMILDEKNREGETGCRKPKKCNED